MKLRMVNERVMTKCGIDEYCVSEARVKGSCCADVCVCVCVCRILGRDTGSAYRISAMNQCGSYE